MIQNFSRVHVHRGSRFPTIDAQPIARIIDRQLTHVDTVFSTCESQLRIRIVDGREETTDDGESGIVKAGIIARLFKEAEVKESERGEGTTRYEDQRGLGGVWEEDISSVVGIA